MMFIPIFIPVDSNGSRKLLSREKSLSFCMTLGFIFGLFLVGIIFESFMMTMVRWGGWFYVLCGGMGLILPSVFVWIIRKYKL